MEKIKKMYDVDGTFRTSSKKEAVKIASSLEETGKISVYFLPVNLQGTKVKKTRKK